LVTIPAHRSQDGTRDIPARPGKINAAFAFGGAPLLIQTLEDKTNLKIDHYVEVSFAGFTGVVDALGGIEVCSKVSINDPKSHLVMAAGTHLLDGIEALKYVRTRDFDGRGDIGRMERQQQFVGAVLRKATSSGVLLNPIKLTRFYNATISTVKMDSSVNKNDLLTLAKQMRNLSSSSVRTLTVPLSDPNGSYPGVGSVVIWDEELSTDLWTRIRGDEVLVETIKPTAKATTEPVIIDKFKSKTAADNPCAPAK
jgi:LCP family protein required for cell wall assembly